MNTISYRHKISAFMATVLTICLFFVEIKFLLTEKYKTLFINLFDKTNLLILSIVVIALTIFFANKLVRNRFTRNCIFITLPIMSFGLTYLVIKKLDTSNKTTFRQDLGLQAYYLYLDETSKQYILNYTYPFGKTTIIGDYKQNDSIIYFDKDLKSSFELDYELPNSNSLNINKMDKI